ncbi:MAG: thiamine pyrophosphate-dependent enzyme [Candidatus Bathyarchaeia archaeon]
MKPSSYYQDKYIRRQPSAFCPGCGGGIILNAFVRAIDELGLSREKVLAVSGIGCSAWIPSPNFKGDTLHTTHGRAIAYATGAKAFNPDLTTVVFTGDGDGAGIGGNHLIHAARRNIDLTVILVNNMSYAMTGGQIAPTTLHGERTVTSPYGNPESPFNITELVMGAGASYVAKWSTYQVVELKNSIKEAISHNGFGFIEVLSQCPTQQKRIFDLKGSVNELPTRLMEMFKESTYIKGRPMRNKYFYALPESSLQHTLEEIKDLAQDILPVDHMALGRVVRVNADPNKYRECVDSLESVKSTAGPRDEKIELGVFRKVERPEFTESLQGIISRARGE